MKKIMMFCLMALMVTSAQAACDNLIVNGDFETGVIIAPATSDYAYVDPSLLYLEDPGTYTVGTDPQDFHPAWTSYGDNTTGSGNMLIVNAATDADNGPDIDVVWEQTGIAVDAGTQYTLTYWLSSAYPTAPANIECSIEGDVSGSTTLGTQLAPVMTGLWIEVSYSWTAGASDTSATITLKDLTRAYDGDDFAIDDISLSPPCIEKELTEDGGDVEGEIGIYKSTTTQYVFVITYSGPAALVIDTVPAEFEILGSVVASAGPADWASAKGGKVDKSASIITWDAPAGENTLTVTIQTRESPGKGHGKKEMTVYKPTSCEEDMELNDGATAYELDEFGEPVIVDGEMVILVGPTAPLTVDAVCGAKPCTPENLVVTLSAPTTLSLDWDDVCVGGDPVVYNVYRDGELIAEGLADSEYDDEGLDSGIYCYAVEAEYVPQVPHYESGKSDEVCETVPVP